MIEIELTRGMVTLIDDEAIGLISGYKWCANRIGRTFYAMTNVRLNSGKKTSIYMHRKIMVPSLGLVVDHLDGDGLNNTRKNLRVCTRGENAGRQKPQIGRTSRFKGVSWHKDRNKWESYIHFGGKKSLLGYFHSEREAATAYNEAAIGILGRLAVLNKLEVA